MVAAQSLNLTIENTLHTKQQGKELKYINLLMQTHMDGTLYQLDPIDVSWMISLVILSFDTCFTEYCRWKTGNWERKNMLVEFATDDLELNSDTYFRLILQFLMTISSMWSDGNENIIYIYCFLVFALNICA